MSTYFLGIYNMFFKKKIISFSPASPEKILPILVFSGIKIDRKTIHKSVAKLNN